MRRLLDDIKNFLLGRMSVLFCASNWGNTTVKAASATGQAADPFCSSAIVMVDGRKLFETGFLALARPVLFLKLKLRGSTFFFHESES